MKRAARSPQTSASSPFSCLMAVGLLVASLGAASACDKSSDEANKTAEKAPAKKLSKEDERLTEFKKILAQGMAVPQEELVKSKQAVKLSGTITIEGYEKGRIQIDAFLRAEGPQTPVTTARFEKPGAFSMLLPPEVGEVELVGLVDFAGDGPDQADPRSEYEGNPVDVGTAPIAGIDLAIDITAVVAPPPEAQQNQAGDDNPGGIDIDDSDEILLKPDGG